MQEPTHILTGIIIQQSIQLKWGRRLGATVFICAAAFLSHGVLDRLADMTYHPAKADFNSPFWVIYHSCILVLTIVFLRLWWRPYKWGVTFAMLPDLDWVLIHGQNVFHIPGHFYRQPYMHHFLGLIFDKTWPFSRIRFPKYRLQPWACLNEVALLAALLAVIFTLTRIQRAKSGIIAGSTAVEATRGEASAEPESLK